MSVKSSFMRGEIFSHYSEYSLLDILIISVTQCNIIYLQYSAIPLPSVSPVT